MIRMANNNDAEAIATIYNYYIRNTSLTFEVDAISSAEIAKRIQGVISAGLPWLVYEHEGCVIGYAYAGKWHVRHAYRYSVESTVYVDNKHTKQGIGNQLYKNLLDQLRAAKLHVVIGVIALPNTGSVTLHEQLGFEKAAHFREVGFKFDRWIDVGHWQLKL